MHSCILIQITEFVQTIACLQPYVIILACLISPAQVHSTYETSSWNESMKPVANKVKNNALSVYSFVQIVNEKSLWSCWHDFCASSWLISAVSLTCCIILGLGWAGRRCHIQLWQGVLWWCGTVWCVQFPCSADCCRFSFFLFLSKFMHKVVRAFLYYYSFVMTGHFSSHHSTNWVTNISNRCCQWNKWDHNYLWSGMCSCKHHVSSFTSFTQIFGRTWCIDKSHCVLKRGLAYLQSQTYTKQCIYEMRYFCL